MHWPPIDLVASEAAAVSRCEVAKAVEAEPKAEDGEGVRA